jgi:hypothetical protein
MISRHIPIYLQDRVEGESESALGLILRKQEKKRAEGVWT